MHIIFNLHALHLVEHCQIMQCLAAQLAILGPPQGVAHGPRSAMQAVERLVQQFCVHNWFLFLNLDRFFRGHKWHLDQIGGQNWYQILLLRNLSI